METIRLVFDFTPATLAQVGPVAQPLQPYATSGMVPCIGDTVRFPSLGPLVLAVVGRQWTYPPDQPPSLLLALHLPGAGDPLAPRFDIVPRTTGQGQDG